MVCGEWSVEAIAGGAGDAFSLARIPTAPSKVVGGLTAVVAIVPDLHEACQRLLLHLVVYTVDIVPIRTLRRCSTQAMVYRYVDTLWGVWGSVVPGSVCEQGICSDRDKACSDSKDINVGPNLSPPPARNRRAACLGPSAVADTAEHGSRGRRRHRT